jgi:flagellar protein FliS
MMNARSAAAKYSAVRNQGLITDASPTRLVQIMFEHILSHLALAQKCMERIKDNLPVSDVVAKGTAIAKASRLIGQLNGSLDMERGGQIADNLRALYVYMLSRLILANLTNDTEIVAEVMKLLREIKAGWDQIVTDDR